MVRVLQERYGLMKREDADREQAVTKRPRAEQVGFAW